tara:strand:+ start:5165 stop:6175 length:1011 start_codon:yes stop_codon:yes gene_type:complete
MPMKYLGDKPASDTLTIYKYVASGSQTTFTGSDANGLTLSYDVGDGSCQVFLNGVRLDSSDVTATNGTSVVLAACTAGDIVHIQATKGFVSSDSVSASSGGTFSGAVTMTTPLVAGSGGTGLSAPGTSGNVLTSNGSAWTSATPSSSPITALNNATANELVTVGSTTTELDAESGLTWDGTTLAITGRSTASTQPSFLATGTTNENATGGGQAITVGFGTEVFDVGSIYDGTNQMTAPVTGKYYLYTSVSMGGVTTSHVTGKIVIVTSNREYIRWISPTNMEALAGANTLVITHSCLADMDASDTATISLTIQEGSQVVDIQSTTTQCYFGGILVA